MTNATLVTICGGCFGLAVLMEGIAYVLGARRPHIKNLDKKVKETAELLEKEQGKAKTDKKLVETLGNQLSERQKELSQALIWSQMAPTVLSLMIIPLVLKQLKGQVAGYLPFNIVWPITIMLQSGLEEPAKNAVSMNFYYFINIAIWRSIAKRFYPQVTVPSPF